MARINLAGSQSILLTCNDDISRMRGEAARLGVADFIAKPCPLAALRAEIAMIARRFGLLQLKMNTLMNLPKSA